MTSAENKWNDKRIQLIIGTLLRAGVLIAAFTLLVGASLYLVQHGRDRMNVKVFHSEDAGLRSVSGIVEGVLHGDSVAIIQLGLLLLIATPVARVFFSAIAFALEHDYLYVVLTLVVLAVLSYSLFGSGMR